jgi:nitrogen fixation protein NifT
MKVMLRQNSTGHLLVYVAKKDLEEEVINETRAGNDTIYTLANGWELSISGLVDTTTLPQTMEAKRIN